MNEVQMKEVEFIVKNYPFERQLEQAIEEASEFILAAQKYKRFPDEASRKTDLIEETGDLLICMEEMRLYLGLAECGHSAGAVDESVDYKLARERQRIFDNGKISE